MLMLRLRFSTAQAIVARMWRDRGMLRDLRLRAQRARPSAARQSAVAEGDAPKQVHNAEHGLQL